jgi:hypothetical protein
MPTKTKQDNLISPAQIPPQLIQAGLAGLQGGVTAGMNQAQKVKEEFKEGDKYKNAKLGEKLKMLGGAGLKTFGAYQQGILSGASKSVLGTDFGLGSVGFMGDNNPQADASAQAAVPGQDPAATENIAQNSSAAPNPVFDPSGQNMINNVTGPEETYGSLFT